VSQEYADDARLSARAALWTARTGPQPKDVALERIVGMDPARVLEVGCGQGGFAEALMQRGVDVVAVDQSQRMVELTAARGVDARRADVQSLPFDDHAFDVVVANYMLYHVPDLPLALSQVTRVLRPGGALVAATNSRRQLQELWTLVDRPSTDSETFRSEHAARLLGAAGFEKVERIDIEERFFVTEQAAHAYIRATRFAALEGDLPQLPDGLTVTAAGSVFIACTPA
jgi:ubiquinone/menaquinone biosynthesis C-methylase UbiE